MSDITIMWMAAPFWEKTHAIRAYPERTKWVVALCGRRPFEGWTGTSDEEPKCKQCKAAVEKLRLSKTLHSSYWKRK